MRAHLAAGAAGLTSLGVMGEAAELSEAERAAVLATVLEAAGGGARSSWASPASARDRRRRASAAAAAAGAGVMVSPTAERPAPSRGRGGGARRPADRRPGLTRRHRASRVTVEELVRRRREPLVVGVKAEAPPTRGTSRSCGAATRPRRHGRPRRPLPDRRAAGRRDRDDDRASRCPSGWSSIVATFPSDPDAAERASGPRCCR